MLNHSEEDIRFWANNTLPSGTYEIGIKLLDIECPQKDLAKVGYRRELLFITLHPNMSNNKTYLDTLTEPRCVLKSLHFQTEIRQDLSQCMEYIRVTIPPISDQCRAHVRLRIIDQFGFPCKVQGNILLECIKINCANRFECDH